MSMLLVLKHTRVIHRALFHISYQLCKLHGGFVIHMWVYFRVLLANANELIEMQTRNDSTDPRSSATFYERYHSLEDV